MQKAESENHLDRRLLSSKHLLVFKMFRRRLQYVFSVIILRLERRLQDVLKTSSKDILKTSSRRLGGKQNVYWWYLYLTNLNVYLTNLCFTNLYLTNLGRMRHLEPNNFDIRLILKHTSISILRIKISEASEARKTKC